MNACLKPLSLSLVPFLVLPLMFAGHDHEDSCPSACGDASDAYKSAVEVELKFESLLQGGTLCGFEPFEEDPQNPDPVRYLELETDGTIWSQHRNMCDCSPDDAPSDFYKYSGSCYYDPKTCELDDSASVYQWKANEEDEWGPPSPAYCGVPGAPEEDWVVVSPTSRNLPAEQCVAVPDSCPGSLFGWTREGSVTQTLRDPDTPENAIARWQAGDPDKGKGNDRSAWGRVWSGISFSDQESDYTFTAKDLTCGATYELKRKFVKREILSGLPPYNWQAGPAIEWEETENVEADDSTMEFGGSVPQDGNYVTTLVAITLQQISTENVGNAENCCEGKGPPGGGGASLGSLRWSATLGTFDNGRSAGRIRLNQETISMASSSPASLTYPAPSEKVDVVLDSQGQLRQIFAPQGLADIVVLDWWVYEVHFYHPSNVAGPDPSSGMYDFEGSPYVVWRVENPDADLGIMDRMRFTRTENGHSDVTEISYNSSTDTWLMEEGGGLRITERTESIDGNGNRTTTTTVKNSANEVAASYLETFQAFPSKEVRIELVKDPNGVARTTQWIYFDDPNNDGDDYGRLKAVVFPSGRWERYEYDTMGVRTKAVSQYLDSSLNDGNENNHRVIEVTRSTYDLNGDLNDDRVTLTTERVLGYEVSRSYHVRWGALESDTFGMYEVTSDIVALSPGASWNDTGNLVTETRYLVGGEWHGEIRSIIAPDQTLALYDYERNSADNSLTTTIKQGKPDGGGTDIVLGNKSVRLVNDAGHIVSRQTYEIAPATAAYELMDSMTVTATDNFGRPTTTSYPLRGTSESVLYSSCGCGIQSKTDEEGIVTSYVRDAAGRIIEMTQAGITFEYTLDAEGRRLVTTRIGSDQSQIAQQTNVYNPAGELTSSTDALNQTTTYSEIIDSNGYTVATTTYADGATRIETSYPDGSIYLIDGTAVPPEKFVYGVSQPAGISTSHSYVQHIKLGENGAETEWTRTFYDLAGRAFRRVQPTPTGNRGAYNFYNNKGQLIRTYEGPEVMTTGTNVRKTLFAYDSLGRREYSVVDVDQDDQIDFAGSDRISRTVREVATRGSDIVQKTTTTVWAVENDDSNIHAASVVETLSGGLKTWRTAHGLTTVTETALDGAGGRTVTTTRPDGSYVVEEFQDGLLQSMTERNAAGTQLTKTTRTYDAHGRMASETDAANGATSYEYYADDQVKKVTTPPPATNQSPLEMTYIYDNRGRLVETLHPDSKSTYREYFQTGALKKEWGVRAYPVEYTYTPQGRTKTLTTWKQFDQQTGAGISGAATTSWAYHASSGLLHTKTYPDSTVWSYTYDRLGQLTLRDSGRSIVTQYGYSNAGDLTSIAYSDSTPNVSFAYDRLGNRKQVTDAFGTRQINHAPDGRLLSEDGPLVTGLDAQYHYDNLNRLEKVEYTDQSIPAFAQEYSYQPGSWRLAGIKQGSYSATYGYQGNTHNVAYYYTNSQFTGFSRDKVNRTLNLSVSDGAMVVTWDSRSYTYNAAGQREKTTVAISGEADTYWSHAYDDLGQVTDAKRYWSNDDTVVQGQEFGYSFDDIGNRTSTTTNSRSATYTSHSTNRYQSRTYPGAVDILGLASEDYSEIVVNNVSAQHRKARYFYHELTSDNSQADRYESILVEEYDPTPILIASYTGNAFLPQSPESFTHDDDGNLLSDGRWTYTWDAESRLIAMETKPGLSSSVPRKKLEFGYDYLGRRLQKRVWEWVNNGWQFASSTGFQYHGWNLVAETDVDEFDQSGGLAKSYLWGLDLSGSLQGAGGVGGLRAITVHATSTIYEPYHDANGNVIGLVETGSTWDDAPVAHYDYDAFGNLIRATGPAAYVNPFRFSTKYQDAETGLYYYGYRYYKPDTGRWLNRDPIKEAGGLNQYGFVGNDPVDRWDPWGLSWNTSGQPPTARERFNDWYEREKDDMGWLDSLPDCPSKLKICATGGKPYNCTKGNWRSLSEANETFHPGAKWCMRSGNSFGGAQQCCYDKNGNLISSGLGAGTPDRASASFWNLIYLGHYFHDVRPFQTAWDLDGGVLGHYLGKYLEVRPPNQGGGKCY